MSVCGERLPRCLAICDASWGAGLCWHAWGERGVCKQGESSESMSEAEYLSEVVRQGGPIYVQRLGICMRGLTEQGTMLAADRGLTEWQGTEAENASFHEWLQGRLKGEAGQGGSRRTGADQL